MAKTRALTAVERTAIGELCSMAQLCATSKRPGVRALALLMTERAAMIVRGTTPVNTWSVKDVREFADVYRAHEPAGFAPDRPRRAAIRGKRR